MDVKKIRKLLPEVMQRVAHDESVLDAMLTIMSVLHQPSETLLGCLESKFNPQTAPEEFLPMLSHWMDLLRLFKTDSSLEQNNDWADYRLPIPSHNLRALIDNAIPISQNRGTRYGMLHMLEIATGVSGYTIDDGEQPARAHASSHLHDKAREPFYIRVLLPPAAKPYRELIERIVNQEKPVYVTAAIIQQ